MPRRAKAPRLLLRPAREGRRSLWVIIDRGKEVGTGCSEGDREGAENALARYITQKYEPPRTHGRLGKTAVTDVINLYVTEHAPLTSDGGVWIGYMSIPVLDWWWEKTLSDVNKTSCAAYVKWRVAQQVSDQTARHELKTLRAAINYYHASQYGPLDAVPVVTLPAKAEQKVDYWLTRKMVADRLRAARKTHRCAHVIRLLLIGVYSGTRPGAIMALRWMPSVDGGWIDLESETIHRRAISKKASKKLQPPVRVHRRLLPHLKRWRAQDMAAGITNVVHYFGGKVADVHKSWAAVAKAAGHTTGDGPHITRHTCATWLMQSGVDLNEAASYLGMSPETLWNVYGHHSPAMMGNASKAEGRRAAPMKSPMIAVNAKRTNRESIE
jgi:integrase